MYYKQFFMATIKRKAKRCVFSIFFMLVRKHHTIQSNDIVTMSITDADDVMFEQAIVANGRTNVKFYKRLKTISHAYGRFN